MVAWWSFGNFPGLGEGQLGEKRLMCSSRPIFTHPGRRIFLEPGFEHSAIEEVLHSRLLRKSTFALGNLLWLIPGAFTHIPRLPDV